MRNIQKNNKLKTVIEFGIPWATLVVILLMWLAQVIYICAMMINVKNTPNKLPLPILGTIVFYVIWLFLLLYVYNNKKCTLDDKTLTIETKILGYHNIKKYRLDAIHKITGKNIIGVNTIIITFEQGKLCTNFNRRVRLRYVEDYDKVLKSLTNILTSVDSDKETFYNLQANEIQVMESIATVLKNANKSKKETD